MAPTDEAALRRSDWEEGVAVVLCDGQTWHLRRHTFVPGEYYFTRGSDGATRLRRASSLGHTYEQMVDHYLEVDDTVARMEALFDLAYHMLAANYRVGLAEVSELLRVHGLGDARGEANAAMWDAIAEAALGVVPKPTAVGSAPACSPTA